MRVGWAVLGLCGAVWAQAGAPLSARAAAIEANTAAQADLRENDPHAAVADAGRSIGLDATYQAAYLTRAIAETRLLDDAAAVADATQALTVATTAVERDQVYNVRSTYEQNVGNLAGAIADSRQRLKTALQPDPIHVRLAELERLNGDLDHAFEDANAAVGENPLNMSAFRERALIERMRHDDTAARADFLKAQQLQTDMLHNAAGRGLPAGAAPPPAPPPPPAADAPAREAAIVWRNIGTARLRQNDVFGALQAFSQSIAADPTYFDGWVSRSNLADRFLAYDAGIDDLNKALGAATSDAQRDQVYSSRANLEEQSADYPAALADLQQALETSARPEGIHYRIATVARDQGDLALARKELDAAIAINPQNPSYFRTRAAVERRLGDTAQADTDAADAIQLAAAQPGPGRGGAATAPGRGAPPAQVAAAPPVPSAVDATLTNQHTALDTAFRNGDYTSALAIAKQILAATHSDVTAHNMAANSYLMMKNFAPAADEFHQALALQPGEYHNLAGLLEADFRGGLDDPARQPSLDHLRQMAKDMTLPYGFAYYADAFTVADRKVLVQECNNLCGKFQFRYRFEVMDANGNQMLVLQAESNDFDQANWAKSHPDLQRAGQREFTLDAYRAYVPGEHLPPPGAISATQQGGMIHATYAYYNDGEPTFDRLKTDVTKIVQGLKPAPPKAAMGTIGER